MPTSQDKTEHEFDELFKRFSQVSQYQIGYPVNLAYDYSPLFEFFKFRSINLGDPFKSQIFSVNSKEVERGVIEFFCKLWRFNFECTWGYITNSGTEGNLEGIYVGREAAKGRPAMFYATDNSHYSIFKIAKMLCLNICVIETMPNGEMNYQHFERKVLENKDKFTIVSLNFGTTVRGAWDDARTVYQILDKGGLTKSCYIHGDGALSGFILPFIERDLEFKKYLDSMSISGHKFLGIPFPCGVYLMRKDKLALINKEIDYIGSVDNTISGSRNGHAALFFRYIIEKKGLQGFQQDIEACFTLAEYLVEKLKGSWRNQNSLTVIFPRPSQKIISKWQLATEGEVSHVIVLPHVTKEKLDEFLTDIESDQ
jgi:histidine decarboxylase